MARPTTDRRSMVTLSEFSRGEMEVLSEALDEPIASLIARAVDEWVLSETYQVLLKRGLEQQQSKLAASQKE